MSPLSGRACTPTQSIEATREGTRPRMTARPGRDAGGVRGAGTRHADRLEVARQVGAGTQGGDTVPGGDGGGPIRIDVHDRNEIGLLQAGVDAGVMLAETADADHGDADRQTAGGHLEAARQRITPRLLPRMKAASLPTSGWDGNSVRRRSSASCSVSRDR